MASWGDFSAFAKVAKSTLSAAQKKIDAVLDIQEIKEGQHAKSSISNKPEETDDVEVEDGDGEKESAPASSASLNKLQEDFFTAFGLSSSEPASTGPGRKSKSGDVSKQPWKSLFNTLAGGSSATNEHGELAEHDAMSKSFPDVNSTEKETNIELATSSRRFDADCSAMGDDTLGEMERSSRDPEGLYLSVEPSGETDGWSTEPLVVPTTEADTSDLLSPADASPFFHSTAQLFLVGDDDQESLEAEQATAPVEDTDPPTEKGPLVSCAQPDTPSTPAVSITFPKQDHTLRSSGASASYSGSTASTSSYATENIGRSAESLITVIQATNSDNVFVGNFGMSETTWAMEQQSSLSSSGEKQLSSVFVDSVVTSSSDSNERSVTTVMDGAEEETQADEDNAEDRPSEQDQQIIVNLDYEARTEDPSAEIEHCVYNVLARVSSQLEMPSNTDREDQTDEQSMITEKDDAMGFQMEGDEMESNVEESFIQLARSDSSNGRCCGDSNGGSGRSPTQATTGGKSSGEASADELLDDGEAATTCSDVEVISTPPYDTFSERSSRSGIVSRTAAEWSFNPPSKLFHPSKDSDQRKHAHKRVGSDQSVASCESVPVSASAAAGISRSASFSVQDYEKRMGHLTEMLEARERKLLDIAKENAQLADENEQLRKELQHLHSRISRDANVDAVQRELSERLNSIERKYDSLVKERDALKRKCDNLEREVASRVTMQQLKEKEEQIAELLAEGEKLSKQELKQGNIIKKLREKEKDLEKQLDMMKNKLKGMDDLRQKLKEKDEQEIKYDEMVHELKSTVNRQEKSMSKMRSELEDAKDKCTSYKATVENCARELAELNQDKAMKDAEIERLLAKAAESKEHDLQNMYEEAESHWRTERQSLVREIQCLRSSSTQDEEDYQRREQSLRWEISQLRQKLQETEERNQELAESISTATKPLLRQLDSMQLSFRTQQSNWERVEKSLYERISDAEKSAADAVDKERQAQLSVMEMRTRVEQLEKQTAMLTKEKNKLETALTSTQRDVESYERLKIKYVEDVEAQKHLHHDALEAMNKDKELISAQFDYERRQLKTQYETNIAELTEKLNEKERVMVSLRQQVSSYQDSLQRPVVVPAAESPIPRTFSRTQSLSSTQEDQSQSGYDAWPNDAAGGGYATLLERLRSRLQQREGELTTAKDELRSIQHNRDAFALQLISLSNDKCELEQRVQQLESIQRQHTELDEKYQGLLLLYGEQIERNEELQMDLQDIKAVYKEQLDALLQRPST